MRDSDFLIKNVQNIFHKGWGWRNLFFPKELKAIYTKYNLQFVPHTLDNSNKLEFKKEILTFFLNQSNFFQRWLLGLSSTIYDAFQAFKDSRGRNFHVDLIHALAHHTLNEELILAFTSVGNYSQHFVDDTHYLNSERSDDLFALLKTIKDLGFLTEDLRDKILKLPYESFNPINTYLNLLAGPFQV